MPDKISDPSQQIRQRPEWLINPSQPPGITLQVNAIAEADVLTPEVLKAVEQAIAEIQKAASTQASKEGCGRLEACDAYTGSCNRLVECGTYGTTKAT